MKLSYLLISLGIGMAVGLSAMMYTVDQTDEAIVLHLGEIKLNAAGQPMTEGPGLHFKSPFVTSVQSFDMRLRNLNIDSSRIVTSEQKDVIVDAFVKWRINDIVAYYKATGGDELVANKLLSQKVSDDLRAEFGKQTIVQLVSGDRSQVMSLLQQNANNLAKPLGIEVVDVRLKRIDLPDEVTESVYQRMRSDREKEAALIRAQGVQNAEQIRAAADAQVTVLLSKANLEAADAKAKGQEESAKIYAEAYGKDPNFFEFWRALQAYKAAFSARSDVFVLNPDSPFLKHLNTVPGV